jgi:hypothetical protein
MLTRTHMQALEAYAGQRFEEALALLEEVRSAEVCGPGLEDGPVTFLTERIEHYLAIPPPAV